MKRIDIVGGSYWESCLEPVKKEFYGSGGRGAATIAQLPDTEVHLHTVGDGPVDELAKEYAFTPHVTPGLTVSFDYIHPFSTPRITPPETSIEQTQISEVTGDTVLRYGMMEATPVVRGKRVILYWLRGLVLFGI